MPDVAKPKDAHVEQRLRTEPMIWLSSVRPDGRPHLVPVWFLWDGSTILIFSQPNNQKIRDLQHNPNVMLALEAANQGADIVLVEGRAELLNDPASPPTIPPAYAEKYASLMQEMGSNAEAMAKSYSQAIRITPTRFISWDE